MDEKDLLSIREFSKVTGIKQSKLRHYDEINLFRPIKRGENGYRYYSAPQAITANCINVMHSLKLPAKKINEFKGNRNPADMLELLQRHELELNQELLRLQQAYSLIHTYCGLIQEGLGANEENVSVKSMAATPIELGPVTDFSSGHFYESFFVFLKQMKDRKINTAYPIGGVYEDIGTFAKNPGQPSRFFSLAPSGRDEKEAGEYLVGYARGYYGNVGDLPDRILAGAKENDIRLAGPVYEIYLHDEISVENPEQYLIQVSAAVRGR